MAKATAALARLKVMWKIRILRMKTKVILLHSRVASMLLYTCESWMLNKQLEMRIIAFENNCYRILLQVHYTSNTMDAEIHRRVEEQIGPFSTLLQMVKKRKLMWFGHVMRAKGTLANTIPQGKVEGQRARVNPARQWLDDIVEWTKSKRDL